MGIIPSAEEQKVGEGQIALCLSLDIRLLLALDMDALRSHTFGLGPRLLVLRPPDLE